MGALRACRLAATGIVVCLVACEENAAPRLLQLEEVERPIATGTRVGGQVSGLVAGRSLVLRKNGGDDLTILVNGPFTFAKGVSPGDLYDVSVLVHPFGQACTVDGGSGLALGDRAPDVVVTCVRTAFFVMGTVTGLAGGDLVLRNGTDTVTVRVDGSFVFPIGLAGDAAFDVQIDSAPPEYACVISPQSGVIMGDDPQLSVTCTLKTYSIGGTIIGRADSALVLQNNAGDDLAPGGSGTFEFATALPAGQPYDVVVASHPTGGECLVLNGGGVVPSSNVTHVYVLCGLAPATFSKINGPPATGNMFPTSSGAITYQNLHPASVFNASGRVTKLRFRKFSTDAADISCKNTTIRVGHTTKTALTPTFANNFDRGTAEVVFSGTLVVPAGGPGTLVEVPLSTPFVYNGVENLLLQIDRPSGCTAFTLLSTTAAPPASRAFSQSSSASTATTLDAQILWMQLDFGGGEDGVLPADGTSPAAASVPPATAGRAQFLLRALDIVGSGPITGIGFPVSGSNPLTSATFKVTLSHVSAATMDLSDTFANNVGADPTLVADVALSIPEASSRWWVPFSQAFTYNGTDNLLVDVEADVSDAFSLRLHDTSSARVMWSADAQSPTGTVETSAAEPVLRFAGAPLQLVEAPGPLIAIAVGGLSRTGSVVTATSSTPHGFATGLTVYLTSADVNFAAGPKIVTVQDPTHFTYDEAGASVVSTLATSVGSAGPDDANASFFGNGVADGVASLFRAPELGSSGLIYAVSCRLATSQGGTYPGYQVIIGHSPSSSLSNAASDLPAAVVAYTGEVAIPGNVSVGDWLRIRLLTPFAYDGTSNLIVWMGSTSDTGTGDNACSMFEASSVRSPANVAQGVPGTAFGATQDRKTLIRIDLVR